MIETNCAVINPQIINNHSNEQNMQSKIESLRKKHPKLTYESFNLKHFDNKIKIRFKFVLDPGILFTPETVIESIEKSRIDNINKRILDKFVFHLGLIELLSYWKTTCSPVIIIKAGFLNKNQVRWWKSLLFNGMMEFFYVNKINFKSSDFVKIIISNHNDNYSCIYDGVLSQDRNLVLTSGGKDSALTLQFLKKIDKNFNCLLVNPLPTAYAVAEKAGCKAPIIVKRTIDPQLLDLNDAGYLNGHTPFSSLIAVLGVMCGVLFDYGKVIVSNERSANEAYVEYLGKKVNHQYSKSYHFEKNFQKYIQSYLSKNSNYFSLLRPLYEVQIAALFARYPQYFNIFKSCNMNQHDNSWCLQCAKCLSTFISLYPFLQPKDVITIFGKDIFKEKNNIPLILELIGLYNHKPFECVGTKKETLAALSLCIQKSKIHNHILPTALNYVASKIIPQFPNISQLEKKALSDWNEGHSLPQEYANKLKTFLISSDEIFRTEK